MPWIDTSSVDIKSLSPIDNLLVYNGLDSCITREVFDAQSLEWSSPSEANDCAKLVYKFELSMMGPAMDMMTQGIRVDMAYREELVHRLEGEIALLEDRLNRIAAAVWGKGLNARSPLQLKAFFYGAMKLPPIEKRFKGETLLSLDRKVLERLTDYFIARPIISHVLAIRDITKQLGVLRSGVDKDGKIRTSYNVAGPETFRWSSSENAMGTGTNLQNIAERLRRVLISDPGTKFAYIDEEQAESRCVAYLLYECLLKVEQQCIAEGIIPPPECSRKHLYIEACESGDLHTACAVMCWPHLPWTGDLAKDKAIADDHSKPFYRDFTLRDMSKRMGHGSNYDGTPFGMSQIIAVEARVIEAFQKVYFAAFPIRSWHTAIGAELATGALVTPLGMRRQFFKRLNDDATRREAIAFKPQSMVGAVLNLGLYRVWQHFKGTSVRPVAQLHDAILLQYPEELESSVIPVARELLSVPVKIADRVMVIPNDVKVGWNFAKADPQKRLFLDGNPSGLIGYTGNDNRKRPDAPASILDRPVR